MRHPHRKIYAPKWLTKIDHKVLIALVIAVGMIAALSTFAAAPKNKGGQKPAQAPKTQQIKQTDRQKQSSKQSGRQTNWEANGADATSCKPGPKNAQCEVSPSEKATRVPVNHEIAWKTANMEEGRYRLSLYYRNYDQLPPDNPYRYHVTIYVNGKKAGEERLVAVGKEIQRFSSKDLDLKKGTNTISLKWDNDQAGNGRDANLAWRAISVHRLANQPGGEQSKSEQYLAEQVMEAVKKGRITFPYQSPNGDSKVVLQKLADGKDAPVTCGNAGSNEANINPNILKFLIAAADKTKVGINAITDKCHSNGSNHYSGEAIDLENTVGDTGQILNVAKQYGGIRNSETSHIHLDFLK